MDALPTSSLFAPSDGQKNEEVTKCDLCAKTRYRFQPYAFSGVHVFSATPLKKRVQGLETSEDLGVGFGQQIVLRLKS